MDWSELQNWDEYAKLLIGLLAVTDPLGALPVALGITERFSAAERNRIAFVSAATFVLSLVLITFVGNQILHAFGITVAALKIAGGLMFMFYALELMGLIELPATTAPDGQSSAKSVGIVPIGIPLLVGPGTISTVIIFGDIHATMSHKVVVSGVVLLVGLIILALFRVTLAMGDRLSATTTQVMNRIMGLLLAAISVEFILDGIVAHFPQLQSVH